jgi:amidophosphoribosyltransferase
MGEELAGEHPAEADLVMPVPDTGAPAAAGFAEAPGIPYREGLSATATPAGRSSSRARRCAIAA